MKAVIIEEHGGPELFRVADIPIPKVAPGTVRVRVHATSLNPVDLLTRSMGPPFAPSLPAILHGDVAGVVDAVAEDVTVFRPGDAVYGCVGGVAGTQGVLAEYVLADARLLARKPEALDFATTAALPLVSIAAWEAVFDRAQVRPGQKVLIVGGAGGVGHIAIQLAKHAGAYVVATASSDEKRKIAEDCGADAVVNYKTAAVDDMVRQHTQGAGFDVVIDTVGGANLIHSFQAAKLNGTVVTIVALGAVDLTMAHMRGLSLHVVFMLIPLLHDVGRNRHGEILRGIARLVDDGKLSPVIDPSAYSFAEVGHAHKRMEAGEHIGKIVLKA